MNGINIGFGKACELTVPFQGFPSGRVERVYVGLTRTHDLASSQCSSRRCSSILTVSAAINAVGESVTREAAVYTIAKEMA